MKWSDSNSFVSFLFLVGNRKEEKEDRKVKRLVQDKAVGWPQSSLICYHQIQKHSTKTQQIIFFPSFVLFTFLWER